MIVVPPQSSDAAVRVDGQLRVDRELTLPTTTVTLDEALIALLRMGKGVKRKAHELACISERTCSAAAWKAAANTASLNSRILGLATYPLYLLHQIVGATIMKVVLIAGGGKYTALTIAICFCVLARVAIAIYMEPSIGTLLRRFSARTTDTILGAAARQRAALSDSVTLGPEQAQPNFGTPHLLGSD